MAFKKLTEVQCTSVEPEANNGSLQMKSFKSEKVNYSLSKHVIKHLFNIDSSTLGSVCQPYTNIITNLQYHNFSSMSC